MSSRDFYIGGDENISFSATGGTRKKTTLRLPSPALGKWSYYFNKILNCDNFNI